MKFIHTADAHFGIENYGKIDAKTGIHSRLLDFSRNFEHIVDYAIDNKVDFFLFCGDAYKTANPTPTQQKLLAQHMLRLHAARIPVVIVVGNHDHPLSFGKAHALDVFAYLPLDGFFVFSKPDLITLPTASGPVQIVGIPWPLRNHVVTHHAHHFKDHHEIATYLSEKIGEVVSSFAEKIDPTIPAVLAGHLTVSSGIFSGSEKCAIYGTDPVFMPSQLAQHAFDYVALGHLHGHQNLNTSGHPAVVYSGSCERVDFGERKESKGFCVVTIANEGAQKQSTYEFIHLPTRPMIQIEVMLNATGDQTEQIRAAIKQHAIQDAIVKIVYHLPEGKNDTVDLGAIQNACQKALYLVGIFPVHKPAPLRERRAAIKVDMDFATILSHYFDTKENLKDRKAVLIEKAFALKQNLEQVEN
ncbi:MAG: exonuclease SbcCD subunit D [Candidatus Babeliales bacterium]|jgi:exonuclease SbcD